MKQCPSLPIRRERERGRIGQSLRNRAPRPGKKRRPRRLRRESTSVPRSTGKGREENDYHQLARRRKKKKESDINLFTLLEGEEAGATTASGKAIFGGRVGEKEGEEGALFLRAPEEIVSYSSRIPVRRLILPRKRKKREEEKDLSCRLTKARPISGRGTTGSCDADLPQDQRREI